MADATNASFNTTHWTELGLLGTVDQTRREEILAGLTRRYWPPVYAYLRRQRLDPDAATEATQAFFTEVVLGRELFTRATPRRGRLRSFLLSALRNFRVDESRRAAARPDRCRRVNLEEQRLESLGADADRADPHTSFERRWALALFDETLARCRRHFVASGRGAHWRIFEARILIPACSGNAPPSLDEIEETTCLGGPAAASAALQVVKRRFECLFREVVAETIGPDDDIEEEFRTIRDLLAGA